MPLLGGRDNNLRYEIATQGDIKNIEKYLILRFLQKKRYSAVQNYH